MKNNLEIFRIWAPDNVSWTEWAKPVLFASLPCKDSCTLNIPNADYVKAVDYSTMVIVDLPGERSVEEGLALAQVGYRPVSLYNGVYGPSNYSMIVNVTGIAAALQKGADTLAALYIRADAPPAFMLDYDRMTSQGKKSGKYDNRWCVFPQDMPSASFLIENGIKKIIVRSTKIQNDLSHILLRYQNQGIKVYLCRDGKSSKETIVSKPSQFKSLFYRFMIIWGLKRNATGGFGEVVPIPHQTSSGGRYYGYG